MLQRPYVEFTILTGEKSYMESSAIQNSRTASIMLGSVVLSGKIIYIMLFTEELSYSE